MSLKTLIVNNLRYFSINFDPSESWERGKERELKREKERREKRGGGVLRFVLFLDFPAMHQLNVGNSGLMT